VRGDDSGLRARLRELATAKPRWGYQQLHILLRREGYVVNHKRVLRLYREEGMLVRVLGRPEKWALGRQRGWNFQFCLAEFLGAGQRKGEANGKAKAQR